MSLRAVEHIFNGATTPIASYDSTKTNLGTLMIQKSGPNPEDNFVGPFPVAIARPMEESTATAMMYPHAITYSSTIDWVFLIENGVAAAKKIYFYEYNKTTANYNWKGFITATTHNATNVCRGFRALRYLHTTGTVSVAAPVSVYSTGTVTVAVGGTMTHSATGFLQTYVGLMVGLGSTDPTKINCWHPIISYTSTSVMTLSGVSSAYAASTPFVIASCVVTGSGTQFVSELIAAGTTVTSATGGLGPRIGFGSTDPTQITQWFQIGRITDNTTINLVTSPGVIASGTSYVIEELRFVMTLTNTTAANGGVYIVKGVGYMDFQTNTVAGPLVLPAIASNIDNQRGVYWLADAGTVTNTSGCGCAIDTETDKTTHWAYVINGLSDVIKIYKYNLRANNSVTAGKMTLSAGVNIIITGNQTLYGFISQINNGRIGTLNHGPANGTKSLYFVTSTRLYRAILANITDTSTNFVTQAESRLEVPPGGLQSFACTCDFANVEISDTIDRLIVLSTNLTGYRNYVTAYPTNDGDQFTHIWGVDDKQQDTSYVPQSITAPHFNSKSQQMSVWSENGIAHVITHGATLALNQMYALPFGAHMTYASTTSQRVITPSLATTGCVKFDQFFMTYEKGLGSGDMIIPMEVIKVYYRTTNISSDATSSWTLVGVDGDLSGISPANAIQFMFEFSTIGMLCIPPRIFNVVVTYEDGSTDSHYQLSTALSDIVAKRFVWYFASPFGGDVPVLSIKLYDAEAGGGALVTDTTSGPTGTWEKSTDGGSNWVVYNADDRANDTTYIRYTPASLTDGIRVRAVLNRN
jgi:hypothetical protein